MTAQNSFDRISYPVFNANCCCLTTGAWWTDWCLVTGCPVTPYNDWCLNDWYPGELPGIRRHWTGYLVPCDPVPDSPVLGLPVTYCPVPGWLVPGSTVPGWPVINSLVPGWPVPGGLILWVPKHPNCCHLDGSYPPPPSPTHTLSKAMWGGVPIKKRDVKPNRVENFLFFVSFFSMVDLLAE